MRIVVSLGLLALALAGCGSTPRRVSETEPRAVAARGAALVSASCAPVPGLAHWPVSGVSGVYRAGPLTLAIGEDLAHAPRHSFAEPGGDKTVAVLTGDRPVTLRVGSASHVRFAFQFTPYTPYGPDQVGVTFSDARVALRFPACGDRPHRFLGGILFAGAGCARVTVTPAGQPGTTMLIPIASPRAGCAGRRPASRRPLESARVPGPVGLRALVTAQTESRVLAVGLPSGRVIGRANVPGDPEYVAISPRRAGSVVVVVSASAGTVTLLDLHSLRPLRVFHGFVSPHIPAIFPVGDIAYVTDDGDGRLTVIGLAARRILARVAVGAGAHHLAISPDWRQVWVALGQSAHSIVTLSTMLATPPPPATPVGDPVHPHVTGRFDPGFLAHDLLFTPDGRRVWITSADTSYVAVVSARTHRLLFRVPGGAPPQHVVFDGAFAYITSGYGGLIEKVRVQDGRVLKRAAAPFGSFDLDAARGYVVTVSLTQGTLAIYDRSLRLLHIRHLAPSTEDVAIARRP